MITVRRLTAELLRRKFPLPEAESTADKETRGTVLAVAGGRDVPGAAVLTGEAILRSGAGRLQIATAREAVMHVGVAVPEALVVPIPPNASGRDARALNALVPSADAVVIGPGLPENAATLALTRRVARAMNENAVLVLDAASLASAGVRSSCIITPHHGEMAQLLDIDRADIDADPRGAVRIALDRFGGVVVLKAATTYIASPEAIYMFEGHVPGLASSGSGDVLAGCITGIAAQGADALAAALWGVWAHASAGRRIARRVGRVGFLARELAAELPRVLR